MMPTKQKCPKCKREFMGSDAIGDICNDCKFDPFIDHLLKSTIEDKEKILSQLQKANEAKKIIKEFIETHKIENRADIFKNKVYPFCSQVVMDLCEIYGYVEPEKINPFSLDS